MTKEEIIKALEKSCDLFEKIQQKKAVLEAEQIIKEPSKQGNTSTTG